MDNKVFQIILHISINIIWLDKAIVVTKEIIVLMGVPRLYVTFV